MLEVFKQLLSSDFTPHGFCYLWDPTIVWLHVVSEAVITAAMRIPMVPMVISLPSRMHLEEVNRKLEREIAERNLIDAVSEDPLRRRVTVGFAVAVLLTVLMGFLTWRTRQLASNESDLATHTYGVMDRIELTSKRVIEVETSARTFALTGQDPLLAHYERAKGAVAPD